jgi:diadenylate cyclase
MSGDLRITDLLDIAIVAAMVFAGIVWLRRSRARFAALGIALVAALYFVVNALEFQLTAWILQGFLAVAVIITVVVFQEDLRRLFERIAVVGLGRRTPAPRTGTVEVIARALAYLASHRCGALLIVPGREPLDRHLEGGIVLDGRVSEPLLLSLFDPGSPGHDGAVVVRGERVERFAAHLPLSSARDQLGALGTRHAAGLGLAERCDALCLVVSEERGTVSIAQDGRLRTLRGTEGLSDALRTHLAAIAPVTSNRSRWRGLVQRWPEALAALAIAAGLWLVRVPGSDTSEVIRTAQVRIENLPPGFEIESIEPAAVEVTLSGTRWELFRSRAQPVSVRIDAVLAAFGRRTFRLGPGQVDHPAGVEPLGISPPNVRISLRQSETTTEQR